MTPATVRSGPTRAAILGAGTLGGALAQELLERPGRLQLALVSDLDAGAAGIGRAGELGAETSAEGIDAIVADPELAIVFDATSARSHGDHARTLSDAGRIVVDLTAAGTGPQVVPAVNLDEHLDRRELTLVTSPAQATVPIVHAMSAVVPLLYAETVSTLPSSTLGPATRRSPDAVIAASARALERIGGARHGKAIMVVSPADPPVAMRNTIYLVAEDGFDREAAVAAVGHAVADMQRRVPGYRLRGEPSCEQRRTPWGSQPTLALTVEVEAIGSQLPRCAGNLAVTIAAARVLGDALAGRPASAERLVA